MSQRSLLAKVMVVIDEHRAQQREISQRTRSEGQLRSWLPGRGNVLFTLLMISLLLWVQSAGAVAPFAVNSATSASTGTVAYQGRLADSSGTPLTSTENMIFRLYGQASGGTPLWTEQWTGSNGVQVSDGLFNVMLGSLTPIPQDVMTGNDSLWLGITVGTDDEMSPRVQLGSVPWAVQALTVPEGSVTTEKIADGAVTVAKLGLENGFTIDGFIEADNLARGYTAYAIGDGTRPIRQMCKLACGGPDSDDSWAQYWQWDRGIYQSSVENLWSPIAGSAHVAACSGCAVLCTCQPYKGW